MAGGFALRFNDWLSSVANTGKGLLKSERGRFAREEAEREQLESICEDLLSSKGEALGTTLACAAVEAINKLDDSGYIAFFELLIKDFRCDKAALKEAVNNWLDSPDGQNLNELHRCSEPRRQELFRRINMAPRGTQTLVALRQALLRILPDHPQFSEIDSDLIHLMGSWFNRGFLHLERIDWETPASILEKLIAYEAVHAMNGWEDLRRRLAADRRCFAFFHPAMDDEPLIFVEVALTQGLAGSVQSLLNNDLDSSAELTADTAIFYSISDCQKGLKGISFGNFLIKQVVVELHRELPNLQCFSTLSPIPGMTKWLREMVGEERFSAPETQAVESLLANPSMIDSISDSLKTWLVKIAAEYLCKAKRGEKPLDPVARFHLRNGASIERVNWAGDLSEKGLNQSLGLMVNYRYDLARVEVRHEGYINNSVVATEKTLTKQLDTEVDVRTLV